MIPRRQLHRVTFLLAGIYNIGWGVFSAVQPQWLFQFAGMPEQNYPEIFDLIWWLPFGLYLYDAWPSFRLATVEK